LLLKKLGEIRVNFTMFWRYTQGRTRLPEKRELVNRKEESMNLPADQSHAHAFDVLLGSWKVVNRRKKGNSLDGGTHWETNWVMQLSREPYPFRLHPSFFWSGCLVGVQGARAMSEIYASSDGEGGMGHPSEHADPTCCRVVELRHYTLKPGRRDDLMALFERHFPEGQEQYGMQILGPFR
jgi:hypothetical protein